MLAIELPKSLINSVAHCNNVSLFLVQRFERKQTVKWLKIFIEQRIELCLLKSNILCMKICLQNIIIELSTNHFLCLKCPILHSGLRHKYNATWAPVEKVQELKIIIWTLSLPHCIWYWKHVFLSFPLGTTRSLHCFFSANIKRWKVNARPHRTIKCSAPPLSSSQQPNNSLKGKNCSLFSHTDIAV